MGKSSNNQRVFLQLVEMGKHDDDPYDVGVPIRVSHRTSLPVWIATLERSHFCV